MPLDQPADQPPESWSHYDAGPHTCSETTDCAKCDATGLIYRGLPEEQDCDACNGLGFFMWCMHCGKPA